MLWITVTSGCFAFVFQQPMGIGLEIRLARGPDFQRMTKGPLGTRLWFAPKVSNIHDWLMLSQNHVYFTIIYS